MDNCKVCGTLFKRHYPRGGIRQIYCSKACRYSDNYVDRICPTCHKPFRTNLLSTRKDYCSLSCIQREPCQLCGVIITGRKTYQSGERRYCSRRCANIVNRTLSAKVNYWTMGYAACLRRHGTIQCEWCGFDNLDSLVIHHKDHDKTNLGAFNLIVLCANCHQANHKKNGRNKSKCIQVAQFIVKHDIPLS